MRDGARLRALYVCYLSLDDPLVHTQVVAYLRGLTANGHRVHLLTFEPRRLPRRRRSAIRRELARDGIIWHSLRYHKWPSLPATALDTAMGAIYSSWLTRRHRLDAIHARSHVPAAMALIAQRLSRFRRRPGLIFDVRGLMAEEYEDAGNWRRDSLPFRITKAVERVAVERSAGIVVLTDRVRRDVFRAVPPGKIRVIPCCADLDSLASSPGRQDAARAALGFGDAPVMIYLGKLGTWYMSVEMVDFFVAARDVITGLKFAILTQADSAPIRLSLSSRHIDRSEYFIGSVAPELVGDYLAASDFGISFIRPSPSKASSSPTKIGEYFAAGLPVVSTSGVGDLDSLITDEIGVLLPELSASSYRDAAIRVHGLATEPGTSDRCREVARRSLSLSAVGIPRYDGLYRELAARRRPSERQPVDIGHRQERAARIR